MHTFIHDILLMGFNVLFVVKYQNLRKCEINITIHNYFKYFKLVLFKIMYKFSIYNNIYSCVKIIVSQMYEDLKNNELLVMGNIFSFTFIFTISI